jgi:hypothetical protein
LGVASQDVNAALCTALPFLWVMAGTVLVIGGVYLVTKFDQQKHS